MDNKSITVVWEDDFCNESYCVVLPEYGLQLLKAKADKHKPNVVRIKVSGTAEAIATFKKDYDEDAFSILDRLSEKYADDDNEYTIALRFAAEISRAKNKWPKA